MKLWKMIFLFKQVIFRFPPSIFQGIRAPSPLAKSIHIPSSAKVSGPKGLGGFAWPCRSEMISDCNSWRFNKLEIHPHLVTSLVLSKSWVSLKVLRKISTNQQNNESFSASLLRKSSKYISKSFFNNSIFSNKMSHLCKFHFSRSGLTGHLRKSLYCCNNSWMFLKFLPANCTGPLRAKVSLSFKEILERSIE